MKKIVNGKQFTIIWNVDYLKMSHIDSNIVSDVISGIDAEYGKIAKMAIMRGKIHRYLGMNINYSLPGKIILSMVEFIGKMLNNIPEKMKGKLATLSACHPFDIVEDTTKLSRTDTDLLITLWRSYCTCQIVHAHTYSCQYHLYAI